MADFPDAVTGPEEPPNDGRLSFADCTCAGIQTEVTCPVHGDREWQDDTTELAPHRSLGPPDDPFPNGMVFGSGPAGEMDVTETVIDLPMVLFDQVESAEDIVDAEIVEEPAPEDLASGDREALETFKRSLATGTTQQACDELLAYLTASEPVRRANPDGEVTPIFGLGEPPDLGVTEQVVRSWYKANMVAMFQRNLSRDGVL